jgi:hypothetical protein
MTFFRKFRYTLACFCLLLYSVQAQEVVEEKGPQSTLHLIVVVDTLASSIKNSTKRDLINVVNEAKKITAYSGMKLKSSILKDKKVDYKNISTVIKNLKVGKNDAIFFYFSGHGYRTEDKTDNPWPNLAFPLSYGGIDFSLIVEQLVKKKPRFILAIADACNNVIDDLGMMTYKEMTKGSSNNNPLLSKNYKKLFLTSSGLIMASAAVPGDYAYALEKGGLFTQAFFASLHTEVSFNGQADWDVLMQIAQDKSNHWVKNVTFVSNGIVYSTKAILEQYPQWIHLEAISDIQSTIRAIGR